MFSELLENGAPQAPPAIARPTNFKGQHYLVAENRSKFKSYDQPFFESANDTMDPEIAQFFGTKQGTPYLIQCANICTHTILMTVRFHTLTQSDVWRNYLLGSVPGVMILPSGDANHCVECACCGKGVPKKIVIYLKRPVATMKNTVSRMPCQLVSTMVNRAKIQLKLPVFEYI